MMDTPEKIVYLEKILFDIPVESLDSLRFHQGYMIQNMKLFNAKDIPKFTEETPDGVTNVEYDCVLNNLIELPIEEFFSELNCFIHEEESLNV